MLSRFHLIPERNGQTDGQTDLLYQYRASVCCRAIRIVPFWWNLVHCIRHWTRWQSRNQKLKFLKFKMAATAIFKIAFLAITYQPIVRFQRNLVWGSRTACRQRLHDKNCKFFKIQDGGRPPSWRSLNRHISVKNCPISMKIGTLQQIMNPIAVTWPKIEIFETQDGGERHIQNRFCGHNSSTDFPISAKFCVKKQNGVTTKATWKNCKFLKSKMADGRHFKNR